MEQKPQRHQKSFLETNELRYFSHGVVEFYPSLISLFKRKRGIPSHVKPHNSVQSSGLQVKTLVQLLRTQHNRQRLFPLLDTESLLELYFVNY